MKQLFLPLLLLAAVAAQAAESATPHSGQGPENPVLKIEGGQVQGVTTEINGVYAFKGIPYAAPPIGELRWKEPQPVVKWDGVKIADNFLTCNIIVTFVTLAYNFLKSI